MAEIEAKLLELSEYSGPQVVSRGIVVAETPVEAWAWLKGTAFGAIIGLLMAIGLVFVWNDIKAYQSQHQAA